MKATMDQNKALIARRQKESLKNADLDPFVMAN